MTNRIIVIIVAAELLLIVLTWRLWFGRSSFPAVPLCPGFDIGPNSAAMAAAGYVLVLATLLLFSGSQGLNLRSRRSLHATREQPADRPRSVLIGISLITGLLITITNQHLLQAWHWFFLLCLLQVAMFGKSRFLVQMLRCTVAAVYLGSAVSRFTPAEETGMTREIVSSLLRIVGKPLAAEDPALVRALSLLMTSGEFFCGLTMILSRSAVLVTGLALLLHLSLIAALSPWGLNHHPAVLCWNASFLLLIPAIVWPEFSKRRSADHPEGQPSGDVRKSELRARRVLMWLLLFGFPLSGLFGIADNWLSWQLYSSRPEIFQLFVSSDAIRQLPQSLQPFVGPTEPLSDWNPVRIDRWSLNETGAPIYPEDRFQLGVIEFLVRTSVPTQISEIDSLNLSRKAGDDQLKIVVEVPERILWWRRVSRVYSGPQGLAELHRQMRQQSFLIP